MGRIKSAITLKDFKKLIKKPGLHAVGGVSGLYLNVNVNNAFILGIKPNYSASWIYRYSLKGKRRDMGLGSMSDLSLEEARLKANELRGQILQDIDPIEKRHELRSEIIRSRIKAVTFHQCVNDFLESHEDAWKNAKHRAQWRSTLETYACPLIGSLNVSDVDTGLILRILEPIWKTKTETATRLRGRIENILDWATVRGYRTGDNPARWKGHIDKLLPKPSKVAKKKNFAALSYKELPQFMQQLRNQQGIGSAALQFAILTAVRSGEVRGAKWGEIDLKEHMWVIPAERMKSGKEHRVPLSHAAVNAIIKMQEIRVSEFIFSGAREGKPLSDMSLTAVLKRMQRNDLTVHGFRSTFRDWASETTAYPREVCEMALAHTITNKVEAAYRRGDLYEKRAQLMNDWAQYCIGKVDQ